MFCPMVAPSEPVLEYVGFQVCTLHRPDMPSDRPARPIVVSHVSRDVIHHTRPAIATFLLPLHTITLS